MEYPFILLPFIFSLSAAFFSVPFVISLANRFSLVDDPKKRYHPASVHTKKIPRAGGLALFTGIFIGSFFLPHNFSTFSIIISCSLLTIVGLIDDRQDVHPYIRLFTNALCAFLVIFSNISIPYVTNPLGSGVINLQLISFHIGSFIFFPLSLVISFLWIYWVMNVVGWSAGVDGQLPGVVVICAAVLGILSLRYSMTDPSQLPVTLLAAIVAGSFLGFLPWNFFPQKIMPGYGGKTLAGFLLAILGIMSYAKFGTALLVLGIPMIDAGFTLVRRIAKGKSPVWADRGHLHHYFLDLGVSKRMIALFYWLFSAILGAVALTVTSQQKIFIFLCVTVLILGFFLWVNWFLRFSKRQDPDNG